MREKKVSCDFVLGWSGLVELQNAMLGCLGRGVGGAISGGGGVKVSPGHFLYSERLHESNKP